MVQEVLARVMSIPVHIRNVLVQVSARRLASLSDRFRSCPQSLQTNAGIAGLPHITLRPFPSASIPRHYSLVILPLDPIGSELLTSASNKSQINKIGVTNDPLQADKRNFV
jgi:hypothetical protein